MKLCLVVIAVLVVLAAARPGEKHGGHKGGKPKREHKLGEPKFHPKHLDANGRRLKVAQGVVRNPGSPPKYGKAPEDSLDKDKVDGDMMFTENTKGLFKKRGSSASNRNMVKQSLTQYLWTDAEICYAFDDTCTDEIRTAVADAISEFESRTCIRFYEYVDSATTPDCVIVTKGTGCSSYVARTGGNQSLSLGDGCESKGTVCHEFMHALGFDHEQNRADRDDYVTIDLTNVKEGYTGNFAMSDTDYFETKDMPYDYGSVLHYGSTYFAADSSKDTITPTDSSATIGQRTGFSDYDVEKLNYLYSCTSDGGTGDTTDTVTEETTATEETTVTDETTGNGGSSGTGGATDSGGSSGAGGGTASGVAGGSGGATGTGGSTGFGTGGYGPPSGPGGPPPSGYGGRNTGGYGGPRPRG